MQHNDKNFESMGYKPEEQRKDYSNRDGFIKKLWSQLDRIKNEERNES